MSVAAVAELLTVELRYPDRVEQTFPGHPASVRSAREWVVDLLTGTRHDLDTIRVAVSELATNAIWHSASATTSFLIWVGWSDVEVLVIVTDDGPADNQIVDLERSGRRGLRIVTECTDDHDHYIDERTGCRAAWFRITTPTF